MARYMLSMLNEQSESVPAKQEKLLFNKKRVKMQKGAILYETITRE